MTMTTRTRYFVIVSLLVLTIGLGTGLVAYYAGFPIGATQGGPEELTLVPRDAVLVAYADVHAVMVSEVRRRILQLLPQGNGQQDFENQTGIKIDTDVDRVVACLAAARPNGQTLPVSGMAIVRGRFNAPKIEALMREHGAKVETYKGKRLLASDLTPGRAGANSISLAFIDPGLVAVGSTDLIRAAVDLRSSGENVTSNESIMNFVRTFEADNAWAVGQFDALSAQAKLPPASGRAATASITWFARKRPRQQRAQRRVSGQCARRRIGQQLEGPCARGRGPRETPDGSASRASSYGRLTPARRDRQERDPRF